MFNSHYLKNLDAAVFDIETTGLLAVKDIVISGGFCDSRGNLWQNFTHSPSAEVDSVSEIMERLEKADAVITYNGDSFDLPFVKRRASKYGIAEELPLFWNIDLYRILKKYWPAAKMMKTLSQKSVEEALGLDSRRTDAIPGGDCVPLYNYFLQTGDEEAKAKILLHNGDDVLQLGRIAHKCSFLPYHEIAFREGFLVKTGARKILVKNCSYKPGLIKISASVENAVLAVSVYDDSLHLEYDPFSKTLEMDIITSAAENYEYTDLRDLPVNIGCFKELPAFHSAYLVLAENGEPDFKTINLLSEELLRAYFDY